MLTLPSPFLSRSPKTLSAAAVLVPPAPSALSNSDLLIEPSPLLSICENRSCSASDGLVEAEVDDGDVVLDIWLCADSSASMVAGEICEPPPVKPVVALEPAGLELWVRPASSNGFSPFPAV